MTPTQRTQARQALTVISQEMDNHKEIHRRVSTSFDLDGIDYQIDGDLYNHYDDQITNCGDIETGIEEVLIDFTFKGSIVGFSKDDDECVLAEMELEF